VMMRTTETFREEHQFVSLLAAQQGANETFSYL
jgi:hypothetical protein